MSETYLTPEARARREIDAALEAAGWQVQSLDDLNLHAARGVAVRELSLKPGHGKADYLLYVDCGALGAVEAKQQGLTLTGVEPQSGKYSHGLPDDLPAWHRPLPFLYESTGVETRFTNLLDPVPRSRRVFAFHRPETLLEAFRPAGSPLTGLLLAAESSAPQPTLRQRLRDMPPLDTAGLWPAQARAVANLEESLAKDRPRALVQMATGSGKTVTAITAIYRLLAHARVRRVLFLVDRANLGRQALKEFQQYAVPGDGRKFTELYNVQLLRSNKIDPVARVVITTIQRLYAILQGKEDLPEEFEEGSQFDTASALFKQPDPVVYNPAVPIEDFEVIVTDECHRSIYHLWRQVLEYFDAYIIGLTATPSKQTLGFFEQNLVMDYNHDQAVADGVNVDFDLYRIRTQITESGSTVESGTTSTGAIASPASSAPRCSTRTSSTRPAPWTATSSPSIRFAPSSEPSATGCSPTSSPAGRRSPRRSSTPRTTATPTTSSRSSGRSSTRATTSPRRSPTSPAPPRSSPSRKPTMAPSSRS